MPNVTLTPPEIAKHDCPSKQVLSGLLHGDLPLAEQEDVTGHLSDCLGCQERMESLATGEQPVLAHAVRDIDQIDPPNQSALWRVIDREAGVSNSNNSLSITRSSADTPMGEGAHDNALDFLQPTTTPGRIGRLNRFDVIELIGRGGMGVVLRAFDPSLQREVAVKVLDPQLASNKSYQERFCREARSAASVSHENIVAVYQVEEDEISGLPFLVMQLVVGESLDQRLRRVGKLSVPEVIRLGAQAAAGLAAAHAVGLIHRDVKPGNMLIEAGTDRLKLTDFGLARATEDMKLTKTGFVSGTPLYMAPEQARGDDVDHRADLFSLGVVMYETLAGKPPFDGKTPLAVLRRVADEAHKPLGELTPDIPEWLEDVIDRLLTKSPNHRFSTAAEVAELLGAHVPQFVASDCDPAVATPCTLTGARSNLSRLARRRLRAKLTLLMIIPLLLGILIGMVGTWLAMPDHSQALMQPIPADSNNTVRPLVRAELSNPVSQYAGNSGGVWSLATSPDGQTLAMGLEDGHIIVYDTFEKKVRTTLDAHNGPVWGLQFLPDAKRFISASDDGAVNVWELGNPKRIQSLPHSSGVRTLAVHPDGDWIATGGRDGVVLIWDLKKEKPVTEFDHGSSVYTVAFEGKNIASAGADKTVKVWDIENKEMRLTLPHKRPVYAVAFSMNAKDPVIATAGWDSVIRIWDSRNGDLKKELVGHEFDVLSLNFCPKGVCLASGGVDGTVRTWDVAEGRQNAQFQAHRPGTYVVRFARDGKSIYSGGRDGYVRQWDSTPK